VISADFPSLEIVGCKIDESMGSMALVASAPVVIVHVGLASPMEARFVVSLNLSPTPATQQTSHAAIVDAKYSHVILGINGPDQPVLTRVGFDTEPPSIKQTWTVYDAPPLDKTSNIRAVASFGDSAE